MAPLTGFLTFIVAVAFSRVYLGAHYLTDIIGGLMFGAAWNLVLSAVSQLFQHRS